MNPRPRGRPLHGVQQVSTVDSMLPRDPRLADPVSGPSLLPSQNAIDIYVSGSVAAPDPTVLTVLLAYRVPSGHQFALTGVMWRFDPPGGFVAGSGDILWTLDVNNPLTPSALAIAGRYVQGFGSELAPIGSLEKPWLFQRPRIFAPSDLIQLKVLTSVAIPQNSGYFNSRFIGYLWPAGE
jgi:hypothetical protein